MLAPGLSDITINKDVKNNKGRRMTTITYDQRITFRLSAKEKARLVTQANLQCGSPAQLLSIVQAYLNHKETELNNHHILLDMIF
jgi:hypothetical protein